MAATVSPSAVSTRASCARASPEAGSSASTRSAYLCAVAKSKFSSARSTPAISSLVGHLRRLEHGSQRVQRDRRAAGVAQLADELDQCLVTAERVRTQDGGAGFLGLIEPHGRERHGGRRLGALRLELLPAARGLGAGIDLLAFRRDLVRTLGDLRVAGAERGLEITIGAAAAVAARQRHVGEHQVGIVRVGGGQGAGGRGQQRGQGQ